MASTIGDVWCLRLLTKQTKFSLSSTRTWTRFHRASFSSCVGCEGIDRIWAQIERWSRSGPFFLFARKSWKRKLLDLMLLFFVFFSFSLFFAHISVDAMRWAIVNSATPSLECCTGVWEVIYCTLKLAETFTLTFSRIFRVAFPVQYEATPSPFVEPV